MKTNLGTRRLITAFMVIKAADLRKFLIDNKRQLMLKALAAKAPLRLDNIPRDGQKLLDIATQIPASMHGILLESLGAGYLAPTITTSKAIDTLLAAEEVPDATDKQEMDACQWSVLHSFLSGEKDTVVLDYFAPKLAAATSLGLHATTRKISDAEASLDSSSTEVTSAPAVEDATQPQEPAHTVFETASTRAKVAHKQTDLEVISEIRPEHDEIIVRRKYNSSNFAEPVGIRRNGIWHPIIDATKRKNLFPQTGDIFIPSSSDNLGEYSSWKVRRIDDDSRPALFRGLESLGPVYRVYDLAVTSNQPDEIRNQLQHLEDSVVLARSFFRLSDGFIFKIRQGLSLATWDFSESIDCWTSLATLVQSPSHDLVLSPLPKPDSTLDLADLAVIAKRVLQQAESFDQFPKFSKNAANELAKWVSSSASSDALKRRTDQLLSRAHSISDQQVLLDAFTDRLLKLPIFQDRIEQKISEAAESSSVEKSKLASEIESLRSQRDTLKKQVDAEKIKSDAVSSKVIKAARKAFEKAVREGEETLGQSAVFAAVLGRNNNQPMPTSRIDAAPTYTSPAIEELESKEPEHFESSLSSIGFSRAVASVIAEAVQIAIRAGVAVILSGPGAAIACRRAAECVGTKRGALVRIKPGVIDEDFLHPLFEQWHELGSLCILNANASAFELYGMTLQENILGNIEGGTKTAPSIFMSLIDSPSALPPSKMLRYMSVCVDLEAVNPTASFSPTHDSWREGVLLDIAKEGSIAPLCRITLKKIEQHLSHDTSKEALILLHNWVIKSSKL